MNSSQKAGGVDADPDFVREGGVAYSPRRREDPFVAFFELMEVVEALCPEWSVRMPDTAARTFRL